jgi:methyltransferase (TIGR00027 family)
MVFEIDQPQVLEFKARVLAGAGPAADRREVAADLRQDWSIPLKAAGFDTRKPTAWSVEGLLPYLTSAAQDDLFASIDELSAPGSRVAVGALGSSCDPQQLSTLESAHPGVNLSGELDFSSLTYDSDARRDPAEWLAEHGWAIDEVSTSPQLQARYGRTPFDVDISVDRVFRSQYVTATRRSR